MKGFGDLNKDKKKINKKNKHTKEEIINQAIQIHLAGNIQEAIKYYQFFINQGWNNERVFSNYGTILQNLGHLKEAEFLYRKAIEINPHYEDAYYNLGNILKDIGKLKEAEIFARKAIEIKPDFSDAYLNLGVILQDLGNLKEAEFLYRKAIELNPNFSMAYFALSDIKYSIENNTKWQKYLFSEKILNNKLSQEKVNIYFARANILHRQRKYKESSKSLQIANDLNLNINPSNSLNLINKSKTLLLESNKREINQKEFKNYSENIFIVGMPRSGSTLLESILSMNKNVYDLGEQNILESLFLEYSNSNKDIDLSELYEEKVNSKTELRITTNKWLFNYQYAGIIASQMPNSKIIHCFRNPLDNILSIYKANFSQKGYGLNQFASSLIDCAKVYLDQEEVMTEYKKKFKSKIYDLNYDLLVSFPNQEIRSLISWLGWNWNDGKYLSPHLNPRSISTASSAQVRSPINSKSLGGWKNYKKMLKPAIDIISQTNKYKNLI